jgi:hypothetical protein
MVSFPVGDLMATARALVVDATPAGAELGVAAATLLALTMALVMAHKAMRKIRSWQDEGFMCAKTR